jgi:hypothetical protein
VNGVSLADRAGRLLDEAAQAFRGHEPAEAWLRRHRERLAEPLRLAVTGPPRSGKSTVVNALIGEDVAPIVVDGAPGAPVWFHDGPQPIARVFRTAAPPWSAPMERADGPGHVVAGSSGDWGEVSRVVAEWPCRALRHVRLLDAGHGRDGGVSRSLARRDGAGAGQDGGASWSPSSGATAGPGAMGGGAMGGGAAGGGAGGGGWASVLGEADAVLYVARHLGDDDLGPLEGAHHGRGVGALPVHVMVVLSRADETAGGRADALLGARQIARRRRREPRVAALCQDVLALSAQMALVGRSLREEEYATIAAVAALPREEAEAQLLSTDRFAGGASPAGRMALLRRLGLGGVRLATTLVRTGARSRTALAAQLVRQSGLSELQATISDLFTARRDALKARGALIALDQLLRAEGRPQTAHLAAELDRLVAGAHELRELRLLAGLRTGRVVLPAELAVEARRLAGGEGTAHAERLGLPAEATPEKLWPAAVDATGRWHEQTRVAATANGRRAAEIVLRSCTAILDDLG